MGAPVSWILLFLAAIWAGAQNALAGGGSFLTLPALMLTGLDPWSANITSTLALFPGQINAGRAGLRGAAGVQTVSLRALMAVSVLGGVLGALLLLLTPQSFFARLLPWLVLAATVLFAWGSFFRKPATSERPTKPGLVLGAQLAIGVYGGYYGGGIGFLMLAALTVAGQSVRTAAATKNVLATVINGAAITLFVLTPSLDFRRIAVLALGALIGGFFGVYALARVPERLLKQGIVGLGTLLTVALFVRQAMGGH